MEFNEVVSVRRSVRLVWTGLPSGVCRHGLFELWKHSGPAL